MLVLSRKKNERIVIADKWGVTIAEVVVVEIDAGKVKLGVVADLEINVNRAEIHQSKFPCNGQ